MKWPEELVAGAPLIHYTQRVEARDGPVLWFKEDYRPWSPIESTPKTPVSTTAETC